MKSQSQNHESTDGRRRLSHDAPEHPTMHRLPLGGMEELASWQQQSESKFPLGAPRQRLHELPHLAAANAAAASPTAEEETPAPPPGDDDPLLDGDFAHGAEVPVDPEEVLDEDAAIERSKDGTTRGEDSGAETNPSAAD